ncbi:hypothetical protein TeGR_g8088 [Tetraparma gracilis]|uniref:Gustatory receptor n=1 Tax=Tetraparma gracilis TaxID=2962635 RepID=A0ABQ6N4D4_9STRA|nr:hypothetical protein TeGR_g8088 [Tetraparma gracilis]
MDTSQEAAEDMVRIYRRTGMVLRPDDYQFVEYLPYVFGRFCAYLAPGLSFFTMSLYHANFTPWEKDIKKVIRNILCVLTTVLGLLISAQFGVLLSGWETRISMTEITVIALSAYSLFQLSKALKWLAAIALASTPTVVRKVQGDVCMFDPEATTQDIIIDVLSFVIIMWTSVYTINNSLGEAVADIDVLNLYADFLLGAIGKGSGLSGANNGGNAKLDFYLRLDSIEAVRAYERFHSTIKIFTEQLGGYHKASIEVLSVVCFASVLGVFVASVMDLEIEAWNVILFVQGGGILGVMLRVFSDLVKLDNKLGRQTVKLYRHQRRLNNELLVRGLGEGERLERANARLDDLCERSEDVHRPLRLLGFLPLTQESLVKIGAATGAGLFTTALRQALNQ